MEVMKTKEARDTLGEGKENEVRRKTKMQIKISNRGPSILAFKNGTSSIHLSMYP